MTDRAPSWAGGTSTNGQSKTIDITMYSDAEVAPWTVKVIDLTQLTGAGPEFTYSLDRSKGSAGDTLHLTITGTAPAQQGKGFLLYSSVGKLANLWPVWVTN